MHDARPEAPEIRLKRLRMRSWRRGMKEMDLIFGGFADSRLSGLPGEALDAYERLLDENDQDIYKWVSGAAPVPDAHRELVRIIADFHGIPG